MAEGGFFPSGKKAIGVLVLALAAIYIANNIAAIGNFVSKKG